MVSFAASEQITLAAEVSQSFSLDNGAFSMWKSGIAVEWADYYAFVEEWMSHPGFDWAVIPDVIDGTEEANDELLKQWPFGDVAGVPVWHLHESLDRLKQLCLGWPRVALGSSGRWAMPGSKAWWDRMGRAMEACTVSGRPLTRLHGLRMLNPEIFRHLPLASADSTNVARNIGMDGRWTGSYRPSNKAIRAAIITQRIESQNSAGTWAGLLPEQQEFLLM